jgi:hypothetical protein
MPATSRRRCWHLGRSPGPAPAQLALVTDQARTAVRPAGGGAAPELRVGWTRHATQYEQGRAAVLPPATDTRQQPQQPAWPAAPDVPADPAARPPAATPEPHPVRRPAGSPAVSGLWSDSRPGCLPRARSGSPSRAIQAPRQGPTRPWCPAAAGSPASRLDGTGSAGERQDAATNRPTSNLAPALASSRVSGGCS